MDALDLSVVVVARNRATVLPKTLVHLEQQSHPAGRYEIIVVDWASSDETAQLLSRHVAGSPVRFRAIAATVSSLGAARNLALQQAQGRWILFLDSDLLAGPRLVEQHVRLQAQHGGHCVAVGRIEQHPQVERNVVLRHYESVIASTAAHNQPLRFVDWRCWNLCVPRAALLEAHGFDEEFQLPGLDDIELAWRLERAGLQGYFNELATAYVWAPVSVDEEIARRYAEGFTLHRVLDKTRSDVLANRYLGSASSRVRVPGRVFAPLCNHVCRLVATHGHAFEWMCRRLSRYAVLQGFHDAGRGRPPRYRVGPSQAS